MARRRTLNYRELRAENDAAERRKQEDEEVDEEEEEGDDEEEEAEAPEGEEEGAEDEEEDEEAPRKKRKPAPVKEVKPKRTRTPKQVRQKVMWVVFNNSNQKIQSFEYKNKKEAEELAARLQVEKKSTFFVQPVKEAME